jgi:hypothetical protein
VSRNDARWLTAKVRSSPSAVTCRVFQYPLDVVHQDIDPGKTLEYLVGQASHLGL